MVQPKAPRLKRVFGAGRLSGPGMAAAFWSPEGPYWKQRQAIILLAGISGLNSSADWEPVDCIVYRITIENTLIKKQEKKTSLKHDLVLIK